MRKYTLHILLAIPLLLLAVTLFNYKTEVAQAIGSILRSGANVPTGSLKMRTSSSTTTPEQISAGISTSTLTFASEGLESAILELQVFASSSAVYSKVQIERLASDDNVDFFPYQVSSTTNLLLTPYISGATTTTYIDLGLLPARYTRINIGVATSSAKSTWRDQLNIWANIIGEIK